MTNRNRSAELERIVGRAIENDRLAAFKRYWDLYKDTSEISSVQGFFVKTQSDIFRNGYCNVAIIGDGLLVDIEGDDSRNSGSLTFDSLNSITTISIHDGPLPGLSSSNGASLVVCANRVNETEIGLHWVAKTDEEEDHLLHFAECLVQEISKK